ncbi:MAG: methyl-accepting chemotaxis protein [Rhodospirillaceae bacterium]
MANTIPASQETLSGLTVGRKILLGFSCVLAILVVVAGLGIMNFIRASENVTAFADVAETAGDVAAIERNFLTMQRHASDYVKYGRTEDSQQVAALSQTLLSQIDAAKAKAVAANRDTAALDVIARDVAVYAQDFEKVRALGVDYRSLLANELVPTGAQLEADLAAVMANLERTQGEAVTLRASEVMNLVLKVQFLTSVAVGREDKSVVETARTALGDLQAGLQRLATQVSAGADRDSVVAMQALVAKYAAVTETILAEQAEITGLVEGEMAQLSGEMSQVAQGMAQAALTEEQGIKETLKSQILMAEIEMIVIGLGGVIVGLVLALLIGRMLSRSINGMSNAMTALADGNLEVTVPCLNRKDELGRMAAAVEVFRQNALDKVRLEEEQKEAERRTEAAKRQMLDSLANTFDSSTGHIIQGVAGASTEMTATATQMSSTASETTQQAIAVASAAEQASTNVQTVAAATEQLNMSITEISNQVNRASTIAGSAADKAVYTQETFDGLVDAADQVGAVIELINDIAEQTNLLALNATIEAARAGDAGKGFAVVANEVKALANQTSKATGQIAERIASIQESTRGAAGSISDIRTTVAEVHEISATIASAIEEQGAATQSIAVSVQQAASGTELVTRNIAEVSMAATQTGEASQEVRSAADELSRQAEVLRASVGTFLSDLRAA